MAYERNEKKAARMDVGRKTFALLAKIIVRFPRPPPPNNGIRQNT